MFCRLAGSQHDSDAPRYLAERNCKKTSPLEKRAASRPPMKGPHTKSKKPNKAALPSTRVAPVGPPTPSTAQLTVPRVRNEADPGDTSALAVNSNRRYFSPRGFTVWRVFDYLLSTRSLANGSLPRSLIIRYLLHSSCSFCIPRVSRLCLPPGNHRLQWRYVLALGYVEFGCAPPDLDFWYYFTDRSSDCLHLNTDELYE
ncbi:hypothetical protein H6P81_011179 [Aristolochia fimbriata]|uniref:Uncharacterized protein n=1 Tax=Aristolochia fimbriata TaxID=158543 RepID=A0AAV7ERH3_ARIFI|nr:hypothetical protein H6P81_011179 [Aristolochia fimbriata]